MHCSAPLIISAICKRWREIAFDIPDLWTTPKIYLYSYKKMALQQRLLSAWLARSGRRPLDISVAHTNSFQYELPLSNPSFIETIVKSVVHLRTLNLCLGSGLSSQFFTGLVCLPALEGLQLWAPELDEDEEDLYRVDYSLPKLPSLKYFRTKIHCVFAKFQDFANLRVCHLVSVAIDEALEFLQAADKVEKCILRSIFPTAESFPPNQNITHFGLRDLEMQPMSLTGTETMEVLFGCLTLPSLHRFAYNTQKVNGPSPFPVDDFFFVLGSIRVLRPREI
ncbi:hypothetical protein CPB84DRAFT_1790438 [Gymnopilus junonius]|uniref:F-box domain-containing protein n=1 Tax=Gymnopilus junonius TaxID=109634 RepID=A0A9P5TIU6_GYMJU|nr:hypothetical protein CPB84DRAFT_1790438 [Gymnopilus junonius]